MAGSPENLSAVLSKKKRGFYEVIEGNSLSLVPLRFWCYNRMSTQYIQLFMGTY